MKLFDQSRKAAQSGDHAPQFGSKGTSFINGFNDLVLDMEPGDLVDLIPEPDNKYDPNAVKLVHRDSGEFIGHLPKENCEEYLQELDNNRQWVAIIDCIFDADSKRDNAGMRLVLKETTIVPGVPHVPLEEKTDKFDGSFIDRLAQFLEDKGKSDDPDSDALEFFVFVRKHFGFPWDTDDNEDDVSSLRVYGAGRYLATHGADISLYSDECISKLVEDMESQLDESAYQFDINSHLEDILPIEVIVHIAEIDNSRDEINVHYDGDENKKPWNNGDPHSTLVSKLIYYVLSSHAKELDIKTIDFL